MTEWIEQLICIKFCTKLEHSFLWGNYLDVSEGHSYGQVWWLAASSLQHARSCITSYGKFFGETSNHPGISVPLQPRFCTLKFQALPKTKITFEREDCQWDSRKYNWAADGNSNKGFCRVFWTVEETLGELYWDPKVPILKGTEAPLSYVHSLCLLSSVNVSIFHITWLDVLIS